MAESILTQVEDFQTLNPEQVARGHGDTGTKPRAPRKRKTVQKGTEWGQFGNNAYFNTPSSPLPLTSQDRAVIDVGMAILERYLQHGLFPVTGPESVKDYLCLAYAGLTEERFGVMFLNGAQQVIAFEQMFRGTLTQTCVYPREVARRALELNAAAVVLAHNHPSGNLTASEADKVMTKTLKDTLRMFDITVVDHIILAGGQALSMAERGLM